MHPPLYHGCAAPLVDFAVASLALLGQKLHDNITARPPQLSRHPPERTQFLPRLACSASASLAARRGASRHVVRQRPTTPPVTWGARLYKAPVPLVHPCRYRLSLCSKPSPSVLCFGVPPRAITRLSHRSLSTARKSRRSSSVRSNSSATSRRPPFTGVPPHRSRTTTEIPFSVSHCAEPAHPSFLVAARS
jgi:hypothetical protein